MTFTNLNELIVKCKNRKGKIRIAIAAADDEYVIKAVARAKELDLIQPIYIGDEVKIKNLAKKCGLNYSDSEIIHASNSEIASQIAVTLIADSKADLLMKGLVPTNILLKQVLNKEKGISGRKIMSHLALFELQHYHKIIGLTDAAMNIDPDLNDKAGIISNAVYAFEKLGIPNPKIALLSAVEKVNPKMKSTTDAALLSIMNKRGQLGNCIVDGPLSLDAAVSAESAHHKGIHSEVCGEADLLLAPDINSGNILYKSLTYLAGAKTAAVILGAKSPIILTSRSDSEETKLFSIALAICLC